MDFLGARIQLNPRPPARRTALLEVGMLGHCPGRVRIERLLALEPTLADIHAAGYGDRLRQLYACVADLALAGDREAALDALDLAVSHLPIPLHSTAEFDDIFPQARTTPTAYSSQLAGNHAWLPQAVDDFFANGGEKLWLVRVPEAEGADGFLPEGNASLLEVNQLRGVACLLVLNQLALVAMPDLERLQIPAQLPDIQRKRLANPKPTFLPLGSLLDDGHRERRYSSEIVSDVPVQPLMDVVRRLLALTSRYRPDIQCLLTLPLSYSASLASPAADVDALNLLGQARVNKGAHLLRQLQLVFPYLRLNQRLFSPAGVIAGAIAANSAELGPWRSVAPRALVSQAQPFPPVDMQTTLRLREQPGIGVIHYKAGRLRLDDERLLVPALHRDDYLLPVENSPNVPANYSARLNGLCSAEVVRFLGYLMRELRELGEHLVFNLDPDDPRPQLVLEGFFRDLYRAGALRGASYRDAFRIQRASRQENVIAFDIEIAPAYPIDKLIITFVNRDGEWSAGLGGTGRG